MKCGLPQNVPEATWGVSAFYNKTKQDNLCSCSKSFTEL